LSERGICIVGGGAWGTALAVHLARAGKPVRLWIRENELVERMAEHRDNPVFLPGVSIPEAVLPFNRLSELSAGDGPVLFVVPSAYARAVYRELSESLAPEAKVVVATKGIEEGSLALPLQVAGEELGEDRPLAVLSGPSFAQDLARGRPTVVAIASDGIEVARELQEVLSSSSLRLYTNSDPLGVQLSGALKNVMAIAAGVADSLGMGSNTMAALITRGLAEMSRLGTKLGGRASTFSGLAGLGDLVLTCTGALSRNRQVGQRLGRGESLQDILGSTKAVAEGVHTTRSAAEMAARAGVEMPIVEEVERILFEGGSPRRAIDRLMSRPLTAE
jgi:glycerol-3-phosphate dehydrogenase (NAD(P)+)